MHAMEAVKKFAGMANTGAYQHRGYCVMVTLNVKNAFNSAPWQGIVYRLHAWNVPGAIERIIMSYLSNREIIYGEEGSAAVTRGVPQGSVLGPLLWNIYYDEVLELLMSEEVMLVGFADD